MKNTIKKSTVAGEEINSISISSQGITIVPVNQKLEPLCNALTWLDARAKTETERIRHDFGAKEILSITGNLISPLYTLPKLMWIKSNLPQIYDNAWKFLLPMDYLIAKFTGICATDYSMATGTLCFDLNSFSWSRKILDHYEIDVEKLPDVVASGTKIGFVLPEIAENLGLKKDCVVALGAQDQKCAAFGAGLEKGVMTISLGTAGAIMRLIGDENRIDSNFGRCGYLEKNSFVTEAVINTAGTCLRWIRDMLFNGEDYDLINREALSARQHGSKLMFYPHLAGPSAPNYYPDSTGVFYGVNLATNRGDFALAVMEGIAFQIRAILERMGAYKDVHTIVLFGGGAKSELWSSIIADITGLKIYVTKSSEVAGAGAAMLAAKAVGSIIGPIAKDREYFPENADEYNKKYLEYMAVEKRIWGHDGK